MVRFAFSGMVLKAQTKMIRGRRRLKTKNNCMYITFFFNESSYNESGSEQSVGNIYSNILPYVCLKQGVFHDKFKLAIVIHFKSQIIQ